PERAESAVALPVDDGREEVARDERRVAAPAGVERKDGRARGVRLEVRGEEADGVGAHEWMIGEVKPDAIGVWERVEEAGKSQADRVEHVGVGIGGRLCE